MSYRTQNEVETTQPDFGALVPDSGHGRALQKPRKCLSAFWCRVVDFVHAKNAVQKQLTHRFP